MTFGYWSLCSIGSLYIIAYVWFFISICIQMCQIWGLKLKDKTCNLGPGWNHMLKELQFGTVCMYSPSKKLRRKMKSAEWLEGHQTWVPADRGRKWIPETMMKTLQWLSSETVWDSISCEYWKQWSHAGNNCFLSCCVLIKVQIPYSSCLGIGVVFSYKELNNIPLSSWSCKGTQSFVATFWGKLLDPKYFVSFF